MFFLIFVSIVSRFIFVGLRGVVRCGEGGGLPVERLFDFHLIVNYFQGVGRLDGRYFVEIHSSRSGTLTP